ncbi:60S ribosomal protein [Venturia nashicola]|nr:60S ribosomal protein [Venturia nashicola]
MASFTLNVPDEALEKLQAKLAATDFPDELDSGDMWKYGAPLRDIKRLTEYWKYQFDWRKAEAKINQLPNFETIITPIGFDPINIHFVHQPSPVKNAIPLLFCHGWPGSFIEVEKLLPLLRGDGSGPAFHVVAPSLPNFGFSGVVKKPGFNLEKYAEVCDTLMQQLGYKEYDHVKASHVNMIRANPPEYRKNPMIAAQHALSPYTEREKKGLERSAWFNKEGSGYNLEQRTKPQTIGYALADSPVALLAWIYEVSSSHCSFLFSDLTLLHQKLHDWTDDYPWSDDEILTWISIYYFSTAGPAASVRIYYEAVHSTGTKIGHRDALSEWIPHVKLGLAYFPRELTVVPQTWGRTLGPVAYESVKSRGGHFAAHEAPSEIAGDLKKMFGKKGPLYGIIKGADGYRHGSKL